MRTITMSIEAKRPMPPEKPIPVINTLAIRVKTAMIVVIDTPLMMRPAEYFIKANHVFREAPGWSILGPPRIFGPALGTSHAPGRDDVPRMRPPYR